MSEQQAAVLRLPQADVQVFSAADVKSQINLIQDIMKSVMKENEHYGTIPGTHKPTLLKAGAEKLGLTFRLAAYFEGENTPINLANNHVKYIIKCTLKHIQTDQIWGQGVGSCSSMESKYRYRWIDTSEKPEKAEAESLKAKGIGKWKKYGSDWIWQKRVDNQDIADVDNTILKMAKKRAHVDAMLNATAASDIFTQDTEDMNANGNEIQQPAPTQKAEPKSDQKVDQDLHAKQMYIGNMLMALVNNDKEKASKLLMEYSKSKDDKYKPFDSVKAIKSAKQADFLIAKIEKDNEQFDWTAFKNTGSLHQIPDVEEMFEETVDHKEIVNGALN